MAEHAHGPDDETSHPVNIAMAVCLVAALGIAGTVIAKAPKFPDVTAESFVLRTPSVDVERLAAERARHYTEPDFSEVTEELEALYAAVKQANEMQFGTPDGKVAHDTQILTVHAANGVITKTGIAGFVPAGAQMFKECATSFESLLADIRAGKLESEKAEIDPGTEYAEYRGSCGNAYAPLLNSGVITAKGEWADPVSGPLVFEIMNRFRWAAVLDVRMPPWEQLAPYEYELLTRWRASISSVPVPKRVEWVVSAGRVVNGFPQHELIGSLLLENGDKVGALGAYEEACKKRKRDIELQRKCEFLRTQVAPRG